MRNHKNLSSLSLNSVGSVNNQIKIDINQSWISIMLRSQKTLQPFGKKQTIKNIPCFYTDDNNFYYYKTKENAIEGPFHTAKIASCHCLLSNEIDSALQEFKQLQAVV